MPITKFPTRAAGVSDRMADFMSHLRLNGFSIGVQETEQALRAIADCGRPTMQNVRLATKSVCTGSAHTFARFDDLFDAFWKNDNRVRNEDRQIQPKKQTPDVPGMHSSLRAWQDKTGPGETGTIDEPDDGAEEHDTSGQGTGELIASRQRKMRDTDLRQFASPELFREAEVLAEQLGKAMRHRRSRRLRKSKRGSRLDLRKMIRRSLAYGGEPMEVFRRHNPRRPSELVILLDASGSMTLYAKIFLAFLRGFVTTRQRSEAFLFHTRLVRISDALRDKDSLRALNRLSLLANGFGGGTQIGSSLAHFNKSFAAQSVNGRSIVMIISDGYDTDPPALIQAELVRLRKRGCRVIWLNPLKGWRNYEAVAGAMTAALPHVDIFASAATLGDLADLEPHLARL